jgi:isoleucyl-tRNA synthetase
MSEDTKKNYKDTLRLPTTTFPMRAGLVESEPLRLEAWEKSNLYERISAARKADNSPKYILHDGPPFANGDVHMGTALNKVLKDLVLKSKGMAGHYCPFTPGWDCHGLPIEFKVVQETRGLEPAEIRTRAEAFARKFIDIQRASFRRLGVFADWDKPYLTLSPEYEADIIRVFAKLVEKGLIYQSKKPVLWSYGAQTALAEAEVEYEDRKDLAIYVKFPVNGDDTSLVIWTTTPWTLPANLGIALHPQIVYLRGEFRHSEKDITENLVIAKDLLATFEEKTKFAPTGELTEFKGKDLEGKTTKHPFLDRDSKIVMADFVTTETGTGQVHIAPGHGSDDYSVGRQNDLGLLSPVDDEGKFTDEVGVDELIGMHVFDANVPVLKIVAAAGHLIGKENYVHSYPHCWRSKTPIIFRSVPQFFIRINDFRETALSEIDKVEWLPHWGRNRIYGTVESRPDWCISRQRTWGVPLPVFFEPDTETPIISADLARKVADLTEEGGTNLWFEKDNAWWAEKLGLPAGTTRCNDTLDVWIDSGSSHVAVLERNPELSVPADLYLEATDQHRGWFQSSLMLSTAYRGTAPYKSVLTHGFVVDKDKKKLSKSEAEKAGKPIDAAHYYNKYGADILRLWVSSVDWQNEVPFSEDIFKQTADPYRRFRNVLRILLANIDDFDSAKDATTEFTLLDRWILERLNKVTAECIAAYEKFEFRKVFSGLNQFCTNDLSAIYVDLTKDRMYCDAENSPRRRAAQTAMARVFESLCHLIAPILAYTADEAWEHYGKEIGSIHLQKFPTPDPDFAGTEATEKVDKLLKLRGTIQQDIETARQAKSIGSNNEASVTLTLPEGAETPESLLGDWDAVQEFYMISELAIATGPEITAAVTPTAHAKCNRCWRHLPSVGKNPKADDLCDRCAEVV